MISVDSTQVAAQVRSSTITNQPASSPETVDYDAFLQLLVKQLKTQDPTEPTDSAEFFSQLASFSSVEQQIQINNKLEALLTASQLGEATSLIGKTLTYDGDNAGTVKSVYLDGGGKIVAEMEDGTYLAMRDGISISNGPSANENGIL